ncbi:E3 SUMO-protein ligase CBX4 [Myotis brandtii]|uniref:E3 SUMO-protein ligase CBX4 n=1 Tax=Myotis brandtii TaxID=109478 RepID=S7NMU8_MYOBR|nr:E3 SUMO-protein ligase CBX4 [Myotis brandtii]
MKIVKNKNKNGRIVIVMSKYMENGMQAVKIKSGEAAEGEARAPSHKKLKRSATPHRTGLSKRRQGRRRRRRRRKLPLRGGRRRPWAPHTEAGPRLSSWTGLSARKARGTFPNS